MSIASWVLLGILSAAAGAERVELSVYAAVSLRDVMREALPRCEERAGVRAVLNTAGSSQLALQIEAARKADLFISADEAWMDRLEAAGLVDGPSRRSLVSNRLVVVEPASRSPRIRRPADLAGDAVGRLSLADPRAVPAGRYARAWLESAGLWDRVSDRVIPALDVRAALAAVATGAADAAIVYATDARTSAKVRIAYEVPVEEGPVISYPIAAMSGRPHTEESRDLVECLASPESMIIYERHGFIVPAGASGPEPVRP